MSRRAAASLQAPAAPRELRVTLHAVPDASRTEPMGPHGDALRVRVSAPPVDGKANAALQRWLADALHVPTTAVALVSGHTARRKVFAIDLSHATHASDVMQRWQALCAPRMP